MMCDIQNIMFEFSGDGRKMEERKSCPNQEKKKVTTSLQHIFIVIFVVITIQWLHYIVMLQGNWYFSDGFHF